MTGLGGAKSTAKHSQDLPVRMLCKDGKKSLIEGSARLIACAEAGVGEYANLM